MSEYKKILITIGILISFVLFVFLLVRFPLALFIIVAIIALLKIGEMIYDALFNKTDFG